MKNAKNKTARTIEKFVAKYEMLSTYQKQIIEIKALLFELRTQSCFGQYIGKFDLMVAYGKKLNTKTAPHVCKTLAEQGFLETKKFNVLPELRKRLINPI